MTATHLNGLAQNLNGSAHHLINPSDARGFLELMAAGRLLALALGPASEVLGVSPALSEALGGPLDGDRLARLLRGEEESLRVVSILTLSDGTRVVGVAEGDGARISRLLRRFAEAHRLTPAERAALIDIAAGASAKESAQRLSLSPETVRARRKRIFRKAGVDGCGSILARLFRDG